MVNCLVDEIKLRGMLDVIRKGITDYGVKINLAYFRSETSLNPEIERLYQQNILTVNRQIYYKKDSKKSLDMLLVQISAKLVLRQFWWNYSSKLLRRGIFTGCYLKHYYLSRT